VLAHTEEHRAFMRQAFPVAFDLFYAVFEGTADDVRGRLALGDDPHARSAQGATPLFHVVRSARSLPKANLLFEAGARVEVWDDLGMQPIHWTTGSIYDDDVRCLAWLLNRGASPNESVRRSADLQFHPVGWTPLHAAADRASLAATRLLIDRRADVNVASADGATPLHVAAGKGRVYKALVRALLDGGANRDAADSEGRTPLHVLAGGYGRYRKAAIRLLRHRNARLDARDAQGRRPVDVLTDGHPDTAAVRRLLDGAELTRTAG
jgi:ankyrin repeat protein